MTAVRERWAALIPTPPTVRPHLPGRCRCGARVDLHWSPLRWYDHGTEREHECTA